MTTKPAQRQDVTNKRNNQWRRSMMMTSATSLVEGKGENKRDNEGNNERD
jgi:hypothetical protein